MTKGVIKVFVENGEVTAIKVPKKLKKELEARQADADKQARIDQRLAELQAGEVRYRKSPAHAPVSENASPAASDAQKDMPIEHGAVPETSPLLDGDSPKHTDSAL